MVIRTPQQIELHCSIKQCSRNSANISIRGRGGRSINLPVSAVKGNNINCHVWSCTFVTPAS